MNNKVGQPAMYVGKREECKGHIVVPVQNMGHHKRPNAADDLWWEVVPPILNGIKFVADRALKPLPGGEGQDESLRYAGMPNNPSIQAA
jgi:hypothetical protein